MSNSIWHKYDIKDIPNPHHEILAWTGSKHAVVIIKPAEWRSGDCDWIESWAYIQDILAQADKAERLQKAVDLAVDALDDIRMTHDVQYANGAIRFRDAKDIAVRTKKEIKQLIKGE